jgi:Ca2+-binding RTX toxin-like protein
MHDGQWHLLDSGRWYKDQGGYDNWWYQTADGTIYQFRFLDGADNDGHGQWEQRWQQTTTRLPVLDQDAGEDFVFDGEWHPGHWTAGGHWVNAPGSGEWYLYDGTNAHYWFHGGAHEFTYQLWQEQWRHNASGVSYTLSERGASSYFIYDGGTYDIDPTAGVTSYSYNENTHVGYRDLGANGIGNDFLYNYGTQQWQRWNGTAWENFADPGTSPDFRYDGRDYLIGGNLWYTYDWASNTGSWDYGNDGDDFRYDYDAADRQWWVFAGGSWHESFGPGASSALMYDGEWHQLADGDWYKYIPSAGEGKWWSTKSQSLFYDYEREQWYDGSRNPIFGWGTSEDFVFDGNWRRGRFESLFEGGEWTYNPTGDYWIIYEDGYVYWYFGGAYQYCYSPSRNLWWDQGEIQWRKDNPPINTLTSPAEVWEDNGNTYTAIDLGAAVRVNDADDEPLMVELTALTGFDTLSITGYVGAAAITLPGADDAWDLRIAGDPDDVNQALGLLTGMLIEEFNSDIGGDAQIRVRSVSDLGPADNDVLVVNVGAVNDGPVNYVPSAVQTFETSLVFSAANGNPITVDDSDSDPDDIQVTISAAHGAFTPGGTIPGSVTVTGSGTGSIVFVGPHGDINTALDGLTYTPNVEAGAVYAGTDVVSVKTSDLGRNGRGGEIIDDDDPIYLNVNYRSEDGKWFWVVRMDASDTAYTAQNRNEIVYGTAGDDWISAAGLNGLYKIYGGDGNDAIVGGNNADRLEGQAGKDTMDGEGGKDSLYGGLGDDWLRTSDSGGDFLSGDDGDDYFEAYFSTGTNIYYGGDGNDTIGGNNNGETMYGEAGNDFIYGEGGNDSIDGGAGDDVIWGYAGNDSMEGGSGNDYLQGDTGDDTMIGGEGKDTLMGRSGDDKLYVYDSGLGDDQGDLLDGEDGEDTLTAGSNAAYATLNGGAGVDALDARDDAHHNMLYGDDTSGADSAGDNLHAYNAAYANSLYGGGGNDVMSGSGEGGNYYHGGSGNETITGGRGSDTMDGGTGRDEFNGGLGDDWLYVYDSGEGQGKGDVLNGEGSCDTLIAGTGAEFATLNGGDHEDTMTGSGSGSNYYYGNGGNDSITAGDGNDCIYGGEGNDVLKGQGGNDTMDGEAGGDELYGGLGNDQLITNDTEWLHGYDLLNGDGGADTLTAGPDAVFATLIGGEDSDKLITAPPSAATKANASPGPVLFKNLRGTTRISGIVV